MKQLYVEISEPKTGAIQIENKYYEVVDTYEKAYSIISNKMIGEGSSDDIVYYEDMYLNQNFEKEYKKAEKQDKVSEFFNEMFNGVLKEEDYKKLLEMLDNIPDEFEPEEELAKRIANKNLKSKFYGDGFKVIAEFLESISHEDALAVITYYYFYFGFGYEDQLISDIKDDWEDGTMFEHVERAYTI